MQKTAKLLLGLATLWPVLYLILFFVVILLTTLFLPGTPGQPGPPPLIGLILPLHLITMVVVFALMIFYIVNVFRNDRVEKDKKALWAIVLFMGSMIAMPVYWYFYIWKSSLETVDEPPGLLNRADPSAWTSEANAKANEPEYVPPREPPNWRE